MCFACADAAVLWEPRPPRGRGGRAAQAKDSPARGKQSVSSRRESRFTRRRERAIAREAGAAVRQDIFEVGDEGMAVAELAETLAINPAEVVKILFMKGIMVQMNQACPPLIQTPAPLPSHSLCAGTTAAARLDPASQVSMRCLAKRPEHSFLPPPMSLSAQGGIGLIAAHHNSRKQGCRREASKHLLRCPAHSGSCPRAFLFATTYTGQRTGCVLGSNRSAAVQVLQ